MGRSVGIFLGAKARRPWPSRGVWETVCTAGCVREMVSHHEDGMNTIIITTKVSREREAD